MKKNFIFGGFLLSLTMYGQVGIKTDTPQKSLHVNGSLQITNEFNVGGDARTAGSAGSPGQVLTSQGAGIAPTWNSLQALSGQSSLAFNIFSTGKTVNGSTVFNSVPGLNYTYTARLMVFYLSRLIFIQHWGKAPDLEALFSPIRRSP